MFARFTIVSFLSLLGISNVALAASPGISELCYDKKTDYGFCIMQVEDAQGSFRFFVRQENADTAMLYSPLAANNVTPEVISNDQFELIRQESSETYTFEIAANLKALSATGNGCNENTLFNADEYMNGPCGRAVGEVIGGAVGATIGAAAGRGLGGAVGRGGTTAAGRELGGNVGDAVGEAVDRLLGGGPASNGCEGSCGSSSGRGSSSSSEGRGNGDGGSGSGSSSGVDRRRGGGHSEL